MNHIGDMISKTRQNRNMTQEEFASRLGVTPQAVSRWERGNSLPDVSLIKGICEVLSVSANSLLGIEHAHKVIENNDISMEREIRNNMFAEPLMLEFGSGLIPAVAEGLKTDYLNQCRKELVKETGILIPVLRLRDNVTLEDDEAQILSYDKVLWTGKIYSAENVYQTMIQKVKEVCRENYGQIINKQCVKILIDCLNEDYPGVVEGLVPEKVSYLQVLRRLQEELKDSGNIRNLIKILEELEEKYC
ncbi:MAG: FHIPEP family type III secretion protein [Lachnospiraceae bacterium]|nr:FHIPEP family type III secretion protein [Lachnospiraceae bacterium]